MLDDTVYKTGCGQVFLSEHALAEIGPTLAHYGRRIAIIAGKNAFQTAGARIAASLEKAGLQYSQYTFSGECSPENILRIARAVSCHDAEVMLAVGGGKCIDASKAAADRLGLPIAIAPTIAATCAPYVPSSVLYTEAGRLYADADNTYESIAIFIDTAILNAAPARSLAAGMADALAKYYELYSVGTEARQACNAGRAWNGSAMAAFELARTTRAILEQHGINAYKAAMSHRDCVLLREMYFDVIVLTGVISGLSRGARPIQLAHGFHNAMKRQFPAEMRRFMHGELVGAGILIQMGCDAHTADEIEYVRQWMRALAIPVSIREYGVKLTPEALAAITNELADILPSGTSEQKIGKIKSALQIVLRNE